MKALIDGDILRYQVGYACEDKSYLVLDKDFDATDPMYVAASFKKKKDAEKWINKESCYILQEVILPKPFEIVEYILDHIKSKILFRTDADDYETFLTGGKSFRKDLHPDYKAHRDTSHKPVYYSRIGSYLIDHWNARYAREGLEADDELGILQTDDTVIVTTDKDLDTIPGWHYNWVKDKKYYINEYDAIYNLWLQMLTGDPVDNIKGLPKIGTVKAKKLLGDKTPNEMDFFVLKTYVDYGMEEDFYKNLKLLTILREYPDEK